VTTGLVVYNDSGSIQFDTDNSAFYYVGSGSISVPANEGIFFAGGVPAHDCLFLRCNDYAVAGTMGTGADVTDVVGLLPPTHNATTVSFYLFRLFSKLDPSTLSKFGLAIYKPGGPAAGVLYHSDKKFLRVGARVATPAMSSGMSVFSGLPAGRTYAYANYGNPHRMTFALPPHDPNQTSQDVPSITPNLRRLGARHAGSGFYFEEREPGFFDFTEASDFTGGILVADVTGY
jgi:hypothetical protein